MDLSLLNPTKAKVSQNNLETRWYQILNDYYLKTSPSEYLEFISESKKGAKMQCEMNVISGALMLIDMGFEEEGKEFLKGIGIKGNFKVKISQKRTKFKMYNAKMKNKRKIKAKADYYDLLVNTGANLGITLNSEMLLPEWCSYLNAARKKVENEQQRLNKLKNR